MVVYGDIPPWQPLGTAGPPLPPMAAAFFGLPVGVLAIVLVSQITPIQSPERMEILETIRRPTPSPIFDA
jgi:Na+(H+)/acetate symporter ActP